ncbi:anaerobic magnesium-protoporphyrin IX monomethyl ester cyclase [Streptacidiphilus sp. MAP12-33]|uniref:B12-binding domain-containing radical SAM protein n=1 Tax=Streptacidiphilus sp. MAP12-33 TaxID=3156266 RepID=UPI0035120C66
MSVFVPLGRRPGSEPGAEPGAEPGREAEAGPAAREVPYLLVSPPVTDPTAPYHSIPYLVGAARAAGHTRCRCVDANLDAFEYLAAPARFGARLEAARRLRAEVESLPAPSRLDEIRYRLCLAAEGLEANAAQEALRIFQDPELFHHPPTYAQAVAVVGRWLDLLSLDTPVGVLDGFSLRGKAGVNLCSTADLADPEVIDAVARPFAGWLEEVFRPQLLDQPWEVVGFSVSYTAQLPVALRMARLVRTVLPRVVVVLGGTEIGDLVKYTGDRDRLWQVLRDADLVVPGEGEAAIVGILDAVRDGRPLTGLAGVMSRDHDDTPVVYGSVATPPGPAYDVWDWPRYWSPEPVLLYSPTRGCYWNKCTFCDYGLNTDRPTSPSRERPIPSVLADLTEARRFGRYVYFAVDAMSPRYLRRLSAALAESGLDLRWAAELRLERTFPERAVGQALADAGCVAVSFGYESGAQRILDLIDKGVRIANVPAVLKELADSGVAAQMMGFTGFPTETAQEALTTYEFLHEHEELWTTAGIGLFSLTPGSIVAKEPERFGIEVLPPSRSDDIHRYLPWRDPHSGETHWPDGADPRIPQEYVTRTRRAEFDRPFTGGIDSAHSMLSYGRHGRGLLPEVEPGEEPRVRLVRERTVSLPFASIGTLTDLDAFFAEVIRRTREDLPSTSGDFAPWLAAPGSAVRGRSAVLVLTNGTLIEAPDGLDLDGESPLHQALRLMLAARARG